MRLKPRLQRHTVRLRGLQRRGPHRPAKCHPERAAASACRPTPPLGGDRRTC